MSSKALCIFLNPDKLFTKQKTELGDFLFVIKYVENKEVIDNRALFFQAKYNPIDNSKYQIELHQFHFYRQINNIEFKFGNSLYKKLGIIPIKWKNISSFNSFGDYFLISKGFVIDESTEDISKQYEHKKKRTF